MYFQDKAYKATRAYVLESAIMAPQTALTSQTALTPQTALARISLARSQAPVEDIVVLSIISQKQW